MASVTGAAPPPPHDAGHALDAAGSMPWLAGALPPPHRAERLSRQLRRAAPVVLAGAGAAAAVALRARRRRERHSTEATRLASHADASTSRRSERRSESRRTEVAEAGQRHLSTSRRKAGKAPQPQPEPPLQPEAPTPRYLNERLVDLICGAVAEATQLAALYPLDTLKVRCQLTRRRPLAELRSLLSGGGPAGLRKLYAGCAPAALGASLFGGAYMLAYQAFYRRNVRLLARGKGAAAEDEDALPLGMLALAAGGAAVLANCCTALLEVPLDTARQRLQAGVAAGPLTRVIAASARAGPRVLYAGFVPFLLRTIPLDALQFCVYAGLQSARDRAETAAAAAAAAKPGAAAAAAAAPAEDADLLSAAAIDMVLGGIAGGVSAFLTMPLDCIKTHINCSVAGAPSGVLPVARQIWAASGPRGFFAGTSSRLAERVPSCAVYWLAAEATRRVLSPEGAAQQQQQQQQGAMPA